MMRLPTLALLAAVATTLGPAAAQDQGGSAQVSAADREAIAGCLRTSVEMPRACIGTIAVVCSRQGSGDRREQEIACSRREAAVWRERLDLGGRALTQGLDSGARSRLASVQRSWEAYVSQKCVFLGELQTPARAATTQAACELRESAIRAIELERLARNRERPGQGRPRIER